MDAFLDAIVQFLKSSQGLVASTTTLVTAILTLLAALKKFRPALRRITGRPKQPAGRGAPNNPSRISIGLASVFAMVAAGGLAVGLISHDRLWKRYPLELTGSTNTYSYLMGHFPQAFTNDVSVTDQGSSQALQQAFQTFDYGKTVGNPARTGWIAMSSNGDRALREAIDRNKANADFLYRNYWLSVIVARPPLMIIYRDIPSQDLKIERAATYPPEGDREKQPSPAYSFVRAAELKRYLLAAGSSAGLRIYLPEQQTGTRAIFDGSQREPFEWPAARELPTYIDEFATAGAMLSLVSEVPSSSAPVQPADICKELKGRNLHVALVCTDRDVCDGFPMAALTIVAKILPESTSGGSQFRVANKGECRFLRSIVRNIDKNCEVEGAVDSHHILQIDTAASSAATPPPAVACKW
ncbi:hypothetical protein [Paraburkholderia strydomiana]